MFCPTYFYSVGLLITLQSDVKRFLDEVLGTKVHTLKDEKWGVQLSGGTYSLDINMTKDSDEHLIRMSTLNRSHPALIGT